MFSTKSDSMTTELEDRYEIVELVNRVVLGLDGRIGTGWSNCSPTRCTTTERHSRVATRKHLIAPPSWEDGAA